VGNPRSLPTTANRCFSFKTRGPISFALPSTQVGGWGVIQDNWHLRRRRRRRKRKDMDATAFNFHFQQERLDGDDEDVDEKEELRGPFSVSTWITTSPPTRRRRPSINCSSIPEFQGQFQLVAAVLLLLLLLLLLLVTKAKADRQLGRVTPHAIMTFGNNHRILLPPFIC